MNDQARDDSVFISTDRSLLDLEAIHAALARSYWSPGIPSDIVRRAVAGSLPFGVYDRLVPRPARPDLPAQVGFARVITDAATYAYLSDVYILESHRGGGLGVRLIGAVLAHPDLRGLRRIALMTRDAQTLYERFGFRHTEDPSRYMEIVNREVYSPAAAPPVGPAGAATASSP
ncbi:MAG: GNAT family N-acetyltransferase [Phycisphaeraceae bacterium]|nr:GNAT family N-acetyltransferase [Phycisphaeraceae bacterium]